MVRFIETCDEHLQKFNFGHFLNSLRVFSRFPLSSERKIDFQKAFGILIISFSLRVMTRIWERVLLGDMDKNE